MTPSLRVLMISLDAELACVDAAQRTNNVVERHLRYAEHVESLRIIVKTTGHHAPEVVQPRANLWIYPTRSSSSWRFLRDACRLGSELCRRQRIDCLSCQDPFMTGMAGAWLKRRFGIPLNVHIMGDMLDNPHFLRERPRHRLLHALAKRVIAQADTLRVPTERQRNQMAQRCSGRQRVWSIPLAVEAAACRQASGSVVRARYLTPPYRFLLVSVARLSPEKDLGMLLQAMRLVVRTHRDIVLLIVGDGPERRRLEALSRHYEVAAHVRFVGPLDGPRALEHIAACDALVLTSRYEGLPRVLVEAGLCRKPAIATKTAGALEVIRDGASGYLVYVGDAALCARRIIALMDDPVRRRQMGEHAARVVQPYGNTTHIVEQYLAMWRATVNGRVRS